MREYGIRREWTRPTPGIKHIRKPRSEDCNSVNYIVRGLKKKQRWYVHEKAVQVDYLGEVFENDYSKSEDADKDSEDDYK